MALQISNKKGISHLKGKLIVRRLNLLLLILKTIFQEIKKQL